MMKLNSRIPIRLWDFAFLSFFAFLGLTDAVTQTLTAFGIDSYLNSFVERLPPAVLCTVIAVWGNYQKTLTINEATRI